MKFKSKKQLIKYTYCRKWIKTVWKQLNKAVKNEKILL